MLRTKLFKYFAALILVFGLISGWFVVTIVQRQVVGGAQQRVQHDLDSAWSLYRARLHELETVLLLTAGKRTVVTACREEAWQSTDVRDRLQLISKEFGIDFLGLVSPDGVVAVRAAPPYARGDVRLHDTFIAEALAGRVSVGTVLMSEARLARESADLVERAYFELENTPHARATPLTEERRGMVMVAAIPVRSGAQVTGVVYGGVLLNRNTQLIDSIKDSLYDGETYEDAPFGTATIFLKDSRITTTVRRPNGNRALGTRVSREVAERVLDNGIPWVGKAFVVKDWYLSAYEPIRDLDETIVGMLYVGILQKPFKDLERATILRYVALTAVTMLVCLLVAFYLANRLARPIHRLVEAAEQVNNGTYPQPVDAGRTNAETRRLTHAFNAMVVSLKEREAGLSEANRDLNVLNRSYMETLGFVTHELKTPMGAIMNYAYLLREGMLGPTTEKQAKAVTVIDGNVRRVNEMIRHYLNLSRIERKELQPQRTRVALLSQVILPMLDALEPEFAVVGMTVQNLIDEEAVLDADLNMVREVYENLVHNAVKYGREGGTVTLASYREESHLRLSVRNEGPGIPPDAMDRLFQKFSRLDNGGHGSRSRGTGLGLFITRHIIEAHGGWIEARSEVNQWAEFVFVLPRYAEEETTPEKEMSNEWQESATCG